MNETIGKNIVKKFTIETINYINAFEKIAKVRVKDCVIDENGLMFIIDSMYIGRAIGVKGRNIRFIEERFKKKVRIIEFDNDVNKFVKNLLYPIRPREIKLIDNKVEIIASDVRMKGRLIGRDRKNLNRLQELVSRYFNYTVEVL